MRWCLLAVVVCLASSSVPQDPESRASSKPTTRRLPPIEEPFRTDVERRDLLQRFTKPSPLEGFYQLRSVNRGGATVRALNGYAYFGRRHMTLHTSFIVNQSTTPYVQSSVRSYQIESDRLVTTVLSGHEYNGRLRIEPPGRVEVRKFRRSGTVLRIYRAPRSFMEFVRVE